MGDDSTSFSIDIPVQSAGIDPAAAQLANLAAQLEQAGAASEAAAAAVAEGQAAYNQVETSADKAAKALERITVAADAQRGKLQAALDVGNLDAADRASAKLDTLVAKQAAAAAKADAAKSALASEAAALDKLKAAAATAADGEDKLNKAHEQAQKAAGDTTKSADQAGEATGNFRAVASALGRLGGPLGQIGQQGFAAAGAVQKLATALGPAGPYVAVAVAFVAIVAAVGAATIAVTKWAVSLADAARTQSLLTAGIAGTVAGGKMLEDKITDLTSKVPQSRDELMGLASDLAKTGLKGQALSDALEDAAVKAAKAKWGPDYAKQLLSLDSQTARFKSNVSNLFGGLNIESLLGSLSKVIALFDSTSVTGKAIKVVFESMFQPIIDGLATLGPKIVTTFIQLEIYALKAAIIVKQNWSTIEGVAKLVGYALAAVAVVLAAVVAWVLLTAAAAATLVGGVVYLIMKFLEFTHAGDQIVAFAGIVASQFTFIYSVIKGAIDFISGLSLSEIGSQLIAGLAAGITGGAGAVVDAITGVAGGAVDAAKKALGIASPSKVFAEIGMNTAAGMSSGVDSASGDVQSSLQKMVSPTDIQAGGATPSAAPAAKSGGGGGGSDLSGATFNFYGVEGAEDALGRFKDLLTQVLDGDASQLGTAVPNA